MTVNFKNNSSEYAEAFSIFSQYDNKPFSVHAEHDEIFAGPNPSVVSAEHLKRLNELGWRKHEEFECFCIFT
jgi:hypothetical protein